MKKSLIFILLIIIFTMIQTCQQSSRENNGLTRVNAGMMFIPSVQFAPYYVALEKGYYRDAGLDVHLDYSSQSDAIQLLGLKRFDFVVGDGEQVIIARDHGLPVVSVLSMYATYPVGLASLATKKIELPGDLKSKTIGVPEYYGASYIGLKAFLKQAGLSDSEVEIIAIGYTQAASITQGRVDAAVVYLNNTPLQLKAAGQQIHLMPFHEHVSLISAGLMTHDEMIQNRPEIVRRFVAATLKAMTYTQSNPDETLDICLGFIGQGEANRALQAEVLNKSLKLFRSPYTDKYGLGMNDPEAWRATRNILQELDIVTSNVSIDKCFTNRFVDSGLMH